MEAETDGGERSSATLVVNVLNANDNYPVFTEKVTARSGLPLGSI